MKLKNQYLNEINNYDNKSALYLAVEKENIEIVELLLRYTKNNNKSFNDINNTFFDEKTAQKLAQEINQDISKLFIEINDNSNEVILKKSAEDHEKLILVLSTRKK